MADIVSELASKCGISPDMAQKGLGMVLGLMKSKLPAETFSKISASVPGADTMMSAVDSCGHEGGGMMDTVKGMVGKVFGGGDAITALISKFGQVGMTPDQLHQFIPTVMEYFKSKLPANVMDQISHHLPVPQEAGH